MEFCLFPPFFDDIIVRQKCLIIISKSRLIVKTFMSTTYTVRIPRELKERMDENPAEWSQEIRNFLEERVKQMELLKTIQEIELRAERRRTTADSVMLIREDREDREC
jgi:predicted DNA-binding protein